MNVVISKGASNFISRRGIETITLTYLEIETACQIGICKDIDLSYDRPENPEKYRRLEADDVEVFVDRQLNPAGDIHIKKQWVWKFASLYVDNVGVPL